MPAPPPRKPPQPPARGQIYSGPAPGSEAFAARRAAQAGVVTDHERKVATLLHASGLAGCMFPLANVIAPLVIWLSGRKDSRFIDEQGKAAVNFQISVTLAVFLLPLLGFVPGLEVASWLGITILVVLAVVRTILVAAAAHRGEDDPVYGFGFSFFK